MRKKDSKCIPSRVIGFFITKYWWYYRMKIEGMHFIMIAAGKIENRDVVKNTTATLTRNKFWLYSTLAYDDTPLFDAILISKYLFGNAKTTGLTNHHVAWYLTRLWEVSVVRINAWCYREIRKVIGYLTWHGTGLQICNVTFDNHSQSLTIVDKWFSKDIYWANTFHGLSMMLENVWLYS